MGHPLEAAGGTAKSSANLERPRGFRVWAFRVTLLLALSGIGGLGYLALQAEATPPSLDPTLASLATSFAYTSTTNPTLTEGPPTESATPAPTLSSELGSLILASRSGGRSHLRAYIPGSSGPITLTSGDFDDRDPALNPANDQLAFASDRDGGWDLYVMDLQSGDTRRLTNTPGYEGHPSWSPDGLWLTYEAYQQTDFDIWILRVDGSQPPIQLTNQESQDISPAWDPKGRTIAFVSDRDGSPDIFLADLASPDNRFHNLTQTTRDMESDPAFDPSGDHIAYVSSNLGVDQIRILPVGGTGTDAQVVGQGRRPAWAPDGSRLLAILSTPFDGSSLVAYGVVQGSSPALPLPTLGSIERAVWAQSGLPGEIAAHAAASEDAPALEDPVVWDSAGRAGLVALTNIQAPHAALSDAVDAHFNALRDRTSDRLGWDFLSQLDYAFVGLNDPLPPGFQYNDWLYTGRAFAFGQGAVEAGWVEVVREDFGGQTYWRIWVRTLLQDGSLGEPIRERPWDFGARQLSDPLSYDQGGALKAVVPGGYFVDFTRLAADYKFERLPALANWRTYLPGTRFGEFAMTEGLSWLQAMLQMYPPEAIATPTEFRTPTPTPTRTVRPTPTPWWWYWRTPTPSSTASPMATPTLSP
ncbi:MAG: hypothetical protein WD906_03990 [Anaerolineales bacterium]